MAKKKAAPKKSSPKSFIKLKEGITYAPIDKIEVKEGFNVRKDTEPENELVGSVQEVGVLRPIDVRWKNNRRTGLWLIDGERRFRAAKAAGMHTIAVTNSYDADQLPQAERIVTRLDELSIDDLQELCP